MKKYILLIIVISNLSLSGCCKQLITHYYTRGWNDGFDMGLYIGHKSGR